MNQRKQYRMPAFNNQGKSPNKIVRATSAPIRPIVVRSKHRQKE
jgi:hypothetical protein